MAQYQLKRLRLGADRDTKVAAAGDALRRRPRRTVRQPGGTYPPAAAEGRDQEPGVRAAVWSKASSASQRSWPITSCIPS